MFKKTKIIVAVLISLIILNNNIANLSADDVYEGEPHIMALEAVRKLDTVKEPVINATAAVVIDMDSGRIMYEKNANSKKAIASTTKIMTAIVALENGNLEDIVTVSKRAASVNGSTINLKEGEKIKLGELMYGMMLNSGNDSAIAVAEHVGGTVENFISMMNRKAADLGLKNTSFKTPHGLDVDGHYSTAYELAQISRYALKNPKFAEICCKKTAIISGRSLYNTNEMLGMYKGVDGVKTGYTGQAGRCLVCSATRENFKVISVILGCPTRNSRADGSRKILDYAFNNYKQYTLLQKDENLKQIPVIKGKEQYVSLKPENEIKYPLTSKEIENLKTEILIPDKLEAPILKDANVGSISFSINGNIIAKANIKTEFEVQHKDFFDYMKEIIDYWYKIVV